MKRILLLALLLCSTVVLYGQYYYLQPFVPGNPGGLNDLDAESPYGAGLPASWTLLLQGNNAVPVWSPVNSIPFPFNFDGNPVSQYKVSSSGVLTFSTNATVVPSYNNLSIPNSSIPDASVMVWGLEGSNTIGNIVYQTFGTAPNRQHWVFFTHFFTSGSYVYWGIVFEEGTDDIYIVDMKTYAAGGVSVTAGIQINSTNAVSVNGSPFLSNLSGASSWDVDNYAYRFVRGTQPSYDLTAVVDDVPNDVILSQGPFPITAEFANLGSVTSTFFSFNYRVNGGAVISSLESGFSIPTFSTETVVSSQLWTPPGIGTYTIEVWASNINGNADQVPGNDVYSFEVDVLDTFVERRVLFETFTSSTCGPCVAGNAGMDAFLAIPANNDRVTSIKYQMSWPGLGDAYFTQEGGTRRLYYGISGIHRVGVDASLWTAGGIIRDIHLDTAHAVPAFVSMDATYEQTGPDGKSFAINIDLHPVENINSNNLRLYMAIFEYTTYNNVGSNGETYFDHVMKKMLPDGGGLPIPAMVKGVPVSFNDNWTFQGNYRLPMNGADEIDHAIEHSVEEFSDLGIAVWIQDVGTMEILQSAYATELSLVGQEPTEENPLQVVAYPNPSQGQVQLAVITTPRMKNIHISVRNSLGQLVLTENLNAVSPGKNLCPLELSKMEDGLYFYEVKAGEKTAIGKLLLTK